MTQKELYVAEELLLDYSEYTLVLSNHELDKHVVQFTDPSRDSIELLKTLQDVKDFVKRRSGCIDTFLFCEKYYPEMQTAMRNAIRQLIEDNSNLLDKHKDSSDIIVDLAVSYAML